MGFSLMTAMIFGSIISAGTSVAGAKMQSGAAGRASRQQGQSDRETLRFLREQHEWDREKDDREWGEQQRRYEKREGQLEPYRARGRRGLETMGRLMDPSVLERTPVVTAARPWGASRGVEPPGGFGTPAAGPPPPGGMRDPSAGPPTMGALMLGDDNPGGWERNTGMPWDKKPFFGEPQLMP